jgi:hypothetical protein
MQIAWRNGSTDRVTDYKDKQNERGGPERGFLLLMAQNISVGCRLGEVVDRYSVMYFLQRVQVSPKFWVGQALIMFHALSNGFATQRPKARCANLCWSQQARGARLAGDLKVLPHA